MHVRAVTLRDAYPIPMMDGLLSRLPPVHCISKIDLKDVFWQICLDPVARAKTVFTVLNRPLYAVEEFAVPKTQKQLRRILWMTGWYQRFIPNYSNVVFALMELIPVE